MRLTAPILALALLAVPAVAQDPVMDFERADAQMNAAIAEAQATLPMFLNAVLDAEGVAADDTMVKVAMPTVSGGGAEHIWVDGLRRDEDGFAGYLTNEPQYLGALRAGDSVTFSQDMISDWSVQTPEGLLLGNYTSRVMFLHGAFGDMPFEMIFTLEPVPAEWR